MKATGEPQDELQGFLARERVITREEVEGVGEAELAKLAEPVFEAAAATLRKHGHKARAIHHVQAVAALSVDEAWQVHLTTNPAGGWLVRFAPPVAMNQTPVLEAPLGPKPSAEAIRTGLHTVIVAVLSRLAVAKGRRARTAEQEAGL